MPVSGAMDSSALRIGNILVGNRDDAAGLEATVIGPTIRFLVDATIAITGGDLGAILDDEPLDLWEVTSVSANSILKFQGPRDGMRSYIAIGGGVQVPVLMGSRSTYIKGEFGGFKGRALREGDILKAFISPGYRNPESFHLVPDSIRNVYGHDHTIRVILGPQDTAFTPEGISTFLSDEYTISIHSDRMGYRLEGPVISHNNGADIISDATSPGSIQVPGDGAPIILLADRGTTGGYTKIATVISPDLRLLAQALPGDKLRFVSVTPEEARAIVLTEEAAITMIQTKVNSSRNKPFALVVNGKTHNVVSAEGEPMTAEFTSISQKRRIEASVGEFNFEIEIHHGEEDVSA